MARRRSRPTLTSAPAAEATGSEAAADAAGGDHGGGSAGSCQLRRAPSRCRPRATTGATSATQSDKPEKPGKVTITGPMCGPCGDVARRLTDRPVHCGINGCKRKWIWKADEQLQAFAAGKPNEPPRRMCETCRANFGKLLDREVRCRTSGLQEDLDLVALRSAGRLRGRQARAQGAGAHVRELLRHASPS